MKAKVRYDKERNTVVITGGTKDDPITGDNVREAWIAAGLEIVNGVMIAPSGLTFGSPKIIPEIRDANFKFEEGDLRFDFVNFGSLK